MAARKPGVATPAEISAFVAIAGEHIIVIDARSHDIVEDSAAAGPLAPNAARPRAINIPFDNTSKSMDLSQIPKEWIQAGGGKATVPIITHCGGGGRGQKAKEFCMAAGFGSVINGGGPEDTECWAEFRHL